MKTILAVVTTLILFSSQAQNEVYIHFTPKVGGNQVTPIDLNNTVFHDLNGIAFQIDVMSYYISKLKLTHDGGQEINFDTPDDVKLVTIDDNVFNLGVHSISALEQVDFGVGVPQEWNHLDINLYPTGHPLGNQQNPVMHWGWTSGYFHMALTALGDNNTDDICDQMFEPHCLGDGNYKNKSIVMTGELGPDNIYHIYIDCNIDEWIFGTDPGTTGVQHTDGGVAITVMNNVDTRDVFVANDELGINESAVELGKAWFTSQGETVTLNWKEMKGMNSYTLIDVNGKVLARGNVQSPVGNATFELSKGTYFFNCYNEKGSKIHSLTVIH